MSLCSFVAALHRLEDLPGLARELGFEPTWHELDALDLPGAGGRCARAAVVGRRDRMLALGLEATDPISAARDVARTFARRGQAAIVLGLERAGRRLSVAAAYADCPAVGLDLDRVSKRTLAQLERGRAYRGAAAERVAGWAEALSAGEIGLRFFAEFRNTLERFISALPAPIPRRDRHGLALLSLTRVLFLYFVQARGWLDGRPSFLREELDGCLVRRRSVDAALLRPLFFGTLNRPADARRAAARRFGRIPFLNGGLFEVHPLERRWRAALPNDVWTEAFDGLFERYHFATRGAAGGDGAIGPDMLGRVFEGVMDPGERRESGVYYTPASLVQALTESALTHWLAGRLGVAPDRGLALLADPDPAAIAALRSITVLDPAAGSGAFLLGVLERLVAARIAAGETRSGATRAVLGTNLFGVDLNPNAVRLTELRLWLEVIDAEAAETPEQVPPLPNLDGFMRQGDSLIEPVRSPAPPAAATVRRIAALRAELGHATTEVKRRLVAELRRAEVNAARESIGRALAGVQATLGDLTSAIRAPGLFGEAAPASREQRRAVERLRHDRRRLRRLERRLGDADQVPWFHYASQFADVVGRGGFDLVIGNPPWVRAESLARAERRDLKLASRWFRATRAGGRGYAHLPDLSVPFLERAVDLTRPGGVTAMLVPAKLLTAGYATIAREELARRTAILVVADLGRAGGRAFHATVFPLALVLRRGAAPAGHQIRTGYGLTEPGGPRQDTLGGPPWVLADDPAASAARRLATMHPALGDRFTIRLGVKTGHDAAFLDPGDGVERDLVRRCLRGRDVRAFRVAAGRSMIWTHDGNGAPLARLPAGAARHLAPFEPALRRRSDLAGSAWWSVFRVEGALARWRVAWPDLARRLEAAPLVGPRLARVIPLNTTYVMILPDRDSALRVSVWLNTTWIRRLAAARATVAASGYSRYPAGTVASLPLPNAALHDDALLRVGEAALGGELDQEAADRAAARLLGLSNRECDALRAGG